MKESAIDLSKVVTLPSLYEFLNEWESVPEGHAQYEIKGEQIDIIKLAIELSYQ